MASNVGVWGADSLAKMVIYAILFANSESPLRISPRQIPIPPKTEPMGSSRRYAS
jgi:hypothetical protein